MDQDGFSRLNVKVSLRAKHLLEEKVWLRIFASTILLRVKSVITEHLQLLDSTLITAKERGRTQMPLVKIKGIEKVRFRSALLCHNVLLIF